MPPVLLRLRSWGAGTAAPAAPTKMSPPGWMLVTGSLPEGSRLATTIRDCGELGAPVASRVNRPTERPGLSF